MLRPGVSGLGARFVGMVVGVWGFRCKALPYQHLAPALVWESGGEGLVWGLAGRGTANWAAGLAAASAKEARPAASITAASSSRSTWDRAQGSGFCE